jgi:hypothetical protein
VYDVPITSTGQSIDPVVLMQGVATALFEFTIPQIEFEVNALLRAVIVNLEFTGIVAGVVIEIFMFPAVSV